MINRFKNISWIKIFNLVTWTLILFLVEIVIYQNFFQSKGKQYWMIIPVVLYLTLIYLKKYFKDSYFITISLEIPTLWSLILLFFIIKVKYFDNLFKMNFEIITFLIIVFSFINLAISKYNNKEMNTEPKNNFSNQLFNLFYINTSKAHEIAMLIDNKIMKTVGKEQISEELLKYNDSLNFGKNDKFHVETGYSKEDSSKKRVYENFDVKTTKSIMLREIYEYTQKDINKLNKFKIGDLAVFNNIELKERNIDDTVMILNVLQDSKIKNEITDDLEINLNKMMDKMLDDFTIDYTFDYTINSDNKGEEENGEKEKYIIQLPYKSTDNFENGYQHNDLQLGQLSLVGIYRGKIDFSEKQSISSKFLEIMSDSYNQEMDKTNNNGIGMKLSQNNHHLNNIQLEFNHKKLEEELHLIDVIAIIQELNINRRE